MNFPDPLRSALTEQTPEERWKKTTTFTAAIYNLLWPVGFCKRMRDEIDFHARIGIRILENQSLDIQIAIVGVKEPPNIS